MEKTILYIIFAIVWLAYNIYTAIRKKQSQKRTAVPPHPVPPSAKEQFDTRSKKVQDRKSMKPGHKVPGTSQEILVNEAAGSSEQESEEAMYQNPSYRQRAHPDAEKNVPMVPVPEKEEYEPFPGEIDIGKAVILSEIIGKPKYQE